MPASAAQLVRVGAAHFPPYTVRPEQGADTGLLPQLVEALNALQTDYQFVLVPTSIPRRFRDFQQGRVDMAIFENPKWGWQDIAHTDVDMGLFNLPPTRMRCAWILHPIGIDRDRSRRLAR